MSYEPTNWKTGDVVTSANLNKLENGVANAGGMFFVNQLRKVPFSLDKTFAEIKAAFDAGKLIYMKKDSSSEGYYTEFQYFPLTGLKTYESTGGDDNGYTVYFDNGEYYTSQFDGYPEIMGD